MKECGNIYNEPQASYTEHECPFHRPSGEVKSKEHSHHRATSTQYDSSSRSVFEYRSGANMKKHNMRVRQREKRIIRVAKWDSEPHRRFNAECSV